MHKDNLNELVCEFYEEGVADNSDTPQSVELYLGSTVTVYSGNDNFKMMMVGVLEKVDGYYFIRSGKSLTGFTETIIGSIEFRQDGEVAINLK